MTNLLYHIFVDIDARQVTNKWEGREAKHVFGDLPTSIPDVHEYGKALFNAVIDTLLLESARQHTEQQNHALTLVIYQVQQNIRVVWELLHDGNAFLSTQDVAILRSTTTYLKMQSIAITTQIRILVINMGNDDDDEKMLRRLSQERAGETVVDVLHRPSRNKVMQTLQDAEHAGNSYHIWHFCGELNTSIGLELDGKPLTISQWCSIIQDFSDTTLITLNLSHFEGELGKLCQLELPLLITSTDTLDADIRHTFFRLFYQSLFEDGAIRAFQIAQTNIRNITFTPDDWAKFMLLTSQIEDRLIQIAEPIDPIVLTNTTRDQVFVSYSHADQVWCDDLMTFLTPLRDNYHIKAWVDKQDISVGSDWFEEIYNALHRTKVAVILASKSFFQSSFIKEHELPYIMECYNRGSCKVIWVAVGIHTYEFTPLNAIQAVHSPGQPLNRLSKSDAEDVLIKVVREIAQAMNPA